MPSDLIMENANVATNLGMLPRYPRNYRKAEEMSSAMDPMPVIAVVGRTAGRGSEAIPAIDSARAPRKPRLYLNVIPIGYLEASPLLFSMRPSTLGT